LVALKEEYAGRSRALAEESEAVRDARHASQEAVAERIAARDTAEAAMALAEETYKRERERMDTVLNKAVSAPSSPSSPKGGNLLNSRRLCARKTAARHWEHGCSAPLSADFSSHPFGGR